MERAKKAFRRLLGSEKDQKEVAYKQWVVPEEGKIKGGGQQINSFRVRTTNTFSPRSSVEFEPPVDLSFSRNFSQASEASPRQVWSLSSQGCSSSWSSSSWSVAEPQPSFTLRVHRDTDMEPRCPRPTLCDARMSTISADAPGDLCAEQVAAYRATHIDMVPLHNSHMSGDTMLYLASVMLSTPLDEVLASTACHEGRSLTNLEQLLIHKYLDQRRTRSKDVAALDTLLDMLEDHHQHNTGQVAQLRTQMDDGMRRQAEADEQRERGQKQMVLLELQLEEGLRQQAMLQQQVEEGNEVKSVLEERIAVLNEELEDKLTEVLYMRSTLMGWLQGAQGRPANRCRCTCI